MPLPARRKPIIDKLNGGIVTALNGQDIRARLAAVGADVVAGTPQEFAADIASRPWRSGWRRRRSPSSCSALQDRIAARDGTVRAWAYRDPEHAIHRRAR